MFQLLISIIKSLSYVENSLSKNIGKKKIINEQNDKEIISFPTN